MSVARLKSATVISSGWEVHFIFNDCQSLQTCDIHLQSCIMHHESYTYIIHHIYIIHHTSYIIHLALYESCMHTSETLPLGFQSLGKSNDRNPSTCHPIKTEQYFVCIIIDVHVHTWTLRKTYDTSCIPWSAVPLNTDFSSFLSSSS